MNTIRDAAVITAAGAAGLYFIGRPVLRAWRARGWPTAQGTIIRCSVERVSGSSQASSHVVRVGYRYSPEGMPLDGDRVTFFPILLRHSRPEWAQDQAKRYAEGTAVEVRYDPADPAQAVIETGVPVRFYLALTLAALFFAAGLAGVCRFLLTDRAG